MATPVMVEGGGKFRSVGNTRKGCSALLVSLFGLGFGFHLSMQAKVDGVKLKSELE